MECCWGEIARSDEADEYAKVDDHVHPVEDDENLFPSIHSLTRFSEATDYSQDCGLIYVSSLALDDLNLTSSLRIERTETERLPNLHVVEFENHRVCGCFKTGYGKSKSIHLMALQKRITDAVNDAGRCEVVRLAATRFKFK